MSRTKPFEPRIEQSAIADLRSRLESTRLPEPRLEGWEWGIDTDFLERLCAHWRTEYDFGRLTATLAPFRNEIRDGIHVARAIPDAGASGPPVLLLHGWPGGVVEFTRLAPLLARAGHEVVIPSLPGYGFSRPPVPPLSATGVAKAVGSLMTEGLGHGRFVVQGGDWGSLIGARIAFEWPDRVIALHTSAPGVLPLPGDLDRNPMSEEEGEFASRGARWRLRHGYHLLVQGAAPDSLAVGAQDSPAGLAAWLIPKYREWSDCGGEIERRFSLDELCDFLTLYWCTGTVASSMRLYAAEARARWRFGRGEAIAVPAGVADFPHELVRPPRSWCERIFSDLRRFTEMSAGGHFAAWEEPDLLADDVLALIAQAGAG